MGAKIGGIRETRTKDFLPELKCNAKDRVGLNSAFREAIGVSGCIRHLVLTVEAEILDVGLTVEAKDIAEELWCCLREEPSSRVEVSLTKRPFTGTKEAFVGIEEAQALKLPKASYIKIRWVMGADWRGRDRSRTCWKFGEEGHTMAACTRNPWCYLCTAREEKPRADHIPGTMRCAAFREAAPNRKPLRGRKWSLCRQNRRTPRYGVLRL